MCLPSTLYIRHSPVIKLRSQSGLTFARTLGGNVRNVEGLVIRVCDIVRSCYSRAHDTHPEHDVKSKDHVLEAAAHLAGIPSILPHGGHGWETFIYRSCELLAYAPHRHNTPRTDGKRVATTEGITEPPRRRRGDTLYNSYTTRGKLGAHHLRVDHESDDMASGETILREGPLFQPLPRSASFSERPRASFISLAPSLSLSLSLSGSVNQLIAATHRTAITTAAIVTSRRALLAAGSTRLPASRYHRLPSLPLRCTLRVPSPPAISPSSPDIRSPLRRSECLALPLSGNLVDFSLFHSRFSSVRSTPTRFATLPDGIPLWSILPLSGTALSMYRESTCLALSKLALVSRIIVCTNIIKNYLETKLYSYSSFYQ